VQPGHLQHHAARPDRCERNPSSPRKFPAKERDDHRRGLHQRARHRHGLGRCCAEARPDGRQHAVRTAGHDRLRLGHQPACIEWSRRDPVREFGADGIASVKQAQQFGAFKKIPTVVGFDTVNEAVFPALGPSIVGFYNNIEFVQEQTTNSNAEFVLAPLAGAAVYDVPAEAQRGQRGGEHDRVLTHSYTSSSSEA